MENHIEDPTKQYENLLAKMKEHFLIEDDEPIRIVVATYIASHIASDPLWLFIIAPPSSLKTEIISSFSGLGDIYPLSDLTEKTLLSGWEKGKASLINKLDGKIITMKDFTTVLSMRRESRAIILGQLREIYDGSIKKAYGTGDVVDWHGKVGFIAGVTPEIDRHYSVFQSLGERFIQVRIRAANPFTVALRAIQGTGTERNFRSAISKLMTLCCTEYLKRDSYPKIPTDIQQRLAALASICVKARSHITRNRQNRDVEYMPEPEAPARLVKQFVLLAQGLAWVRDGVEVNEGDFKTVFRVGMDSLPIVRAKIIQLLIDSSIIKLDQVTEQTSIPNTTANRTLEDLVCLGLLEKTNVDACPAWSFSQEANEYMKLINPAVFGVYTDNKSY